MIGEMAVVAIEQHTDPIIEYARSDGYAYC